MATRPREGSACITVPEPSQQVLVLESAVADATRSKKAVSFAGLNKILDSARSDGRSSFVDGCVETTGQGSMVTWGKWPFANGFLGDMQLQSITSHNTSFLHITQGLCPVRKDACREAGSTCHTVHHNELWAAICIAGLPRRTTFVHASSVQPRAACAT